MKKLFLSLKDERNKMYDFYTEKEYKDASIVSLIFTFIIGLLIALITVNVFMVFVYMPYLAYTISGLALIWIIIIYYLFLNSSLKTLKEPEGFSLFKANLLELIIIILVIIVLTKNKK